jgi:hypothetical protein
MDGQVRRSRQRLLLKYGLGVRLWGSYLRSPCGMWTWWMTSSVESCRYIAPAFHSRRTLLSLCKDSDIFISSQWSQASPPPAFGLRLVYVRPCQRSLRRTQEEDLNISTLYLISISCLLLHPLLAPSTADELRSQRQHARTLQKQQPQPLSPPCRLVAPNRSVSPRGRKIIMPATPVSFLRCPGRRPSTRTSQG